MEAKALFKVTPLVTTETITLMKGRETVNVANNSSFEVAIEEWWSKYKYQLSDGSRKRKESMIKIHLVPALKGYLLKDINEEILSDYINEEHKSGDLRAKTGGLSYATIRSHFNIIRPFFDWAVNSNLMNYNVARNVRIPRIPYIANPPTLKQIKNIIKNAYPPYMVDVITLAYRTGLRRGEVYGLEDIDYDSKQKALSIRRIVTAYSPKEISVHVPKTKTSNRSIPLDRVCIRIIKRRIRKNKGKSKFIFSDSDGNILSPWDNTRYFHTACKKAGVPDVRFHDLRHAHATILLSRGVHPKVIQERLGHSSFRITMDTYSHAFPAMQRPAVNVLNRIPQGVSLSSCAEIAYDKMRKIRECICIMIRKIQTMIVKKQNL